MKHPHLAVVVIAAITTLTVGCQSSSGSSNYNQASRTSTSLQDTAASIDEGETQITAVLLALSNLVNHPDPDLKPQYRQFESSVDKLNTLAKNVREQAVAMQEKGGAYFHQWNADLATIQNEDIRSRSQERKNTVEGRFERVRSSYATINDAFVPFMSRLNDVKTVLANDLTRGGLDSVRNVSDQANQDAIPLRTALRQLSTDFKNLGLTLSSSK